MSKSTLNFSSKFGKGIFLLPQDIHDCVNQLIRAAFLQEDDHMHGP